MSLAHTHALAPVPQEAIDAALTVVILACGELPPAKARKRLDHIESGAFAMRAAALGSSNVYRLRGGGTRDEMDAKRSATVQSANAVLEAVARYRRAVFGSEGAARG